MPLAHERLRPFSVCIRLLILATTISSCISTKFAPTPSDRKGDNRARKYGGRFVYTVTCQAERQAKKAITLPERASKYVFLVHPFCEQQKDIVQEVNTTKPLNIVIVLDRTGSMQPSIDAVKSGIEDFAKGLENFNWDAHIAAIGFRDQFNDFRIIEFSDAAHLRHTVNTWKAEGGGDYQEAGLTAINHAHTMLANYTSSHAERKNALNVILYVSDGVAYWGDNHNDFSIEKLAKEAKEWSEKEDSNLRFYYSVNRKLDPQRDQGLDAPPPLKQMQDFVEASKLSGKSLDFPLTRAILLEFSKEFVEVTTTNPLLCQASSASLNSSMEQGTPSRSHLANIFKTVSAGDALIFESSPDIRTTDYTLSIERCCKMTEQTEKCFHTEKIDLSFKFSQK